MIEKVEYILTVEGLKKFENTIPGFEYPQEYLKIAELELIDFDHWFLLSDELVEKRHKSMKERYPHRNVIPFAARYDCDDVACFEIGYGERIFVVHDYSSEGYERRQEYADFWTWFKAAIQELIDGD